MQIENDDKNIHKELQMGTVLQWLYRRMNFINLATDTSSHQKPRCELVFRLFCVGDRFYLCDNKILCEYDYEERMVFANMSYSSDSLAHIKRQVSDLQQPPEESGMAQRGVPSLGPNTLPQNQQQHHVHQQQQPQQQQQQPPTQQQLNMNGMSLSGGLVTGPGTSGVLLPGDRGGLGDHLGNEGGLKAPPAAGPQQPNSSNHQAAVADDASSGYGSPDSLTMEDR
ncbi:uncharacterized protein [Palaemon carinicauda]|uniref:uncharacterized protein n=1 Tax=Palaemon carinicauda TaxID=392227 RepID=UPI0035B64F25